MVALVTGSSRGIGREIILLLAQKGIDVIITYNTNKEKAEEIKNHVIDTYNVKADAIKCDLSNESDILDLKEFIINNYNHLDILVNNAALSLDNNIDDKTKEEFMKVLEVNVVGTFLLTKNLYKYMDNGIIVNVSSTDAEYSYSELNIDYSVSKAGINMLTKEEAMIFNNIKVIGVMPNWTNTEAIKEMNPEYLREELRRVGQKKLEEPEEVAKNIVDLMFDDFVSSGEIRRV